MARKRRCRRCGWMAIMIRGGPHRTWPAFIPLMPSSALAGLLLCRIQGPGRGRKVVMIRCPLPLLIARSRVRRLAGCMRWITPLYGVGGLRRRRILVLRRQGLLVIGGLLLAGIKGLGLPSRGLFGCLRGAFYQDRKSVV